MVMKILVRHHPGKEEDRENQDVSPVFKKCLKEMLDAKLEEGQPGGRRARQVHIQEPSRDSLGGRGVNNAQCFWEVSIHKDGKKPWGWQLGGHW